MPEDMIKSMFLLFVLLNPFLMSIYLLDMIQKLSISKFLQLLIRASIISGCVFIFFSWVGEAFFTDILQVRFASFLILGGVIFLIIAVRYVMVGGRAIEEMRGPAKHVAGSVAIPFMIGPGTVSASIIIGKRLAVPNAILAISLTLIAVICCVVILKVLHDYVSKVNELLVERYIDLTGRISALVIGTIAIEMVLKGIDIWLSSHYSSPLQ